MKALHFAPQKHFTYCTWAYHCAIFWKVFAFWTKIYYGRVTSDTHLGHTHIYVFFLQGQVMFLFIIPKQSSLKPNKEGAVGHFQFSMVGRSVSLLDKFFSYKNFHNTLKTTSLSNWCENVLPEHIFLENLSRDKLELSSQRKITHLNLPQAKNCHPKQIPE